MTVTVTDEQRLTVVKHLASGKSPDVVATITRLDRADVVDVGSHHGYPDTAKLLWAAERMAAKADDGRRAEITEAAAPRVLRPATTSPSSVTAPNARPVGPPDEIRSLINAAKQHPAKRVQAQANRVLDALGKLRDLVAEDEAKHAERRQAEAAKVAARAEITRLEKALADAKAKLRGNGKPTTITVSGDVSAADLRAWAKGKGIDVPDVGRIPAAVREAYAAETGGAA